MWVSLQRLTSTCPNWCHSVPPSFLAIYPKCTKLCFVFWCLKKGLREKCLRGISDVLHIIPVLKKIQSVTLSRRGIAQHIYWWNIFDDMCRVGPFIILVLVWHKSIHFWRRHVQQVILSHFHSQWS